MAISDERLEMIRANAEFAVREMAGLCGDDFGYNAASVAWAEGFLERQRPGAAADNARGIVNILGSYLGEAIIAAVPGARWAEDQSGSLGILFPSGDMAFPFAKVEKQLAGGLEGGESILSFYNTTVNYVAAGKLREATREETP